MTAAPDKAAFDQDIRAAPFLRGVARGKWRLVDVVWPHAVIAVRAAPRDLSPDEYTLRFELTGYPASAPTAGLWNAATAQYLEGDLRPTGGPNVAIAFRNDWNDGRVLYLPCDRLALQAHANWSSKYAARAWRSGSDITHYLEVVYELLNSASYSGTRCALSSAQL